MGASDSEVTDVIQSTARISNRLPCEASQPGYHLPSVETLNCPHHYINPPTAYLLHFYKPLPTISHPLETNPLSITQKSAQKFSPLTTRIPTPTKNLAMGKKKQAQKQVPEKPPSTFREALAEAQPTVPPPPPQTSTAQVAPMVSIDALTAYLQQTNPGVDWGAALAGLSQLGGGTPVIPIPTPDVPPIIILPPVVPTSSTPTIAELSPHETAQPETSEASPTPQPIIYH